MVLIIIVYIYLLCRTYDDDEVEMVIMDPLLVLMIRETSVSEVTIYPYFLVNKQTLEWTIRRQLRWRHVCKNIYLKKKELLPMTLDDGLWWADRITEVHDSCPLR
jgi:hypothetical protein